MPVPAADPELTMFYSATCPFTAKAAPAIEAAEAATGVTITRRDVNKSRDAGVAYMKADNGRCGGVPYFWNSKTEKFICGAPSSAEAVRMWMNKP